MINRYSGEFLELFDKLRKPMQAGTCERKERKF
jgi:hypothetical protein